MSFNFSAMQYERDFRAKSVSNWEYPRFFPPRPRNLHKNAKPIADKNGHLLATAARDGNFLGQYRGTYHLPLRITRSFADLYNRCLSGRHKYWKYPRDLCCCQRERPHPCDFRQTLGIKGDPSWQQPADCQTKCEGLQQMLAINELHKKCKRMKCQPQPNEKQIRRVGEASSKYSKKLRKRPVTAFDYNRRGTPMLEQPQQDQPTDKTKPTKVTVPVPAAASAAAKSTGKSTTKAAPATSKSKPK
ncbi:protein Flattop homolog [Drosophila grimshawi]|uniref:Cilia- and flagella-associated protein 126 n=1 Tax=Drosophila grimshawi TaxID=7222 RepID=B4JX55_DROGR|nr:protein Flattop homolog [Drosophila grimshawi]EDV95331.1 GH17631 [Drosophila grimshawi]